MDNKYFDNKYLSKILSDKEKVQICYIKGKYKDDIDIQNMLIEDYLESILYEKRLSRYLSNGLWARIKRKLNISKNKKYIT